MSETKTETVRLLCFGTVLLSNKKKAMVFKRVDENDNIIGGELIFDKIKGAYVTTIGKIQAQAGSNGDTIYPSTWEFEKQHPNKELCAQIRLTHEANETQIAAISQANKAKNDKTDVLDALAPLRRAYLNTNATGRLALEVRILNYLRNGKDL